ncbi:MAG: hypothetical protein RIQ89_494 [Bacteroidota bacterium]|jgi:hypothetical protein
MKSYFQVLLFCSLSIAALGQSPIIFCDTIGPSGSAVNEGNTWQMDEEGGDLMMLLKENLIEKQIVNFNIFRLERGIYRLFDTQQATTQNNVTSITYKFKLHGDYRVDAVLNNALKGRGFLTLLPASTTNDSSYTLSADTIITDRTPKNYYKASSAYTTDGVLENGGREKKEFRLATCGGEIYVYIDNYKKLKTTTVTLELWKKEGSEYKQPIQTESYAIEPDWEITYFKIKVESKGDYKVSLFNTGNQLINNAYFSLK